MIAFSEMDRHVTIREQLQEGGGPVVLINIFTVEPEEADQLLVAWAADARYMKQQPGFISTYADQVVEEAPRCRAQTVDVSGDGISNIGPAPAAIYASGRLDEVTVNALVVGGAIDSHDRVSHDRQLVSYFEAEVLHGPDAFWILADGYEDYERAMAAKLVRELEAPMVSGLTITVGGV